MACLRKRTVKASGGHACQWPCGATRLHHTDPRTEMASGHCRRHRYDVTGGNGGVGCGSGRVSNRISMARWSGMGQCDLHDIDTFGSEGAGTKTQVVAPQPNKGGVERQCLDCCCLVVKTLSPATQRASIVLAEGMAVCEVQTSLFCNLPETARAG